MVVRPRYHVDGKSYLMASVFMYINTGYFVPLTDNKINATLEIGFRSSKYGPSSQPMIVTHFSFS